MESFYSESKVKTGAFRRTGKLANAVDTARSVSRRSAYWGRASGVNYFVPPKAGDCKNKSHGALGVLSNDRQIIRTEALGGAHPHLFPSRLSHSISYFLRVPQSAETWAPPARTRSEWHVRPGQLRTQQAPNASAAPASGQPARLANAPSQRRRSGAPRFAEDRLSKWGCRDRALRVADSRGKGEKVGDKRGGRGSNRNFGGR